MNPNYSKLKKMISGFKALPILKNSGKRWASLFITFLFIGVFGCESPTKVEEKPDTLYVKFNNAAASHFTITTIQLQAMGVAGETAQPSGTWSENILTEGKKIAPGAHEFFTLPIPNLNWSEYRLGVDDGQGNEVMLHLQEGYAPSWQLPITHWGSDERTVEVTVVRNQENGLIIVTGWSDFSGID